MHQMDIEYELSTGDRFGALLLRKQQLASPTSTTQIHPPKRGSGCTHRGRTGQGQAKLNRPWPSLLADARSQSRGNPAALPQSRSLTVRQSPADRVGLRPFRLTRPRLPARVIAVAGNRLRRTKAAPFLSSASWTGPGFSFCYRAKMVETLDQILSP